MSERSICPICRLTDCPQDCNEYRVDWRARALRAEAGLSKINNIRNSIIGTQKINWSEHIYPLVAALNQAGQMGMPYDEARPYFGTMLERTLAAEQRIVELEAERDFWRGHHCTPCRNWGVDLCQRAEAKR